MVFKNLALKSKILVWFLSANLVFIAGALILVFNLKVNSNGSGNPAANQAIIFQIIIFTILAVVITMIMAILFARSLTSKINLLLPGFMGISNGIMSENIEIDSTDELGILTTSFNKINSKLKVIVTDINSGADSIVAGSNEISNAAQILAMGAAGQANEAEKITSAIEEMTANIDQSRKNTKITVSQFKEAELKMGSLSKVSEESLQVIRTITDKINIINDIAMKPTSWP
jgi:methyl-accepting chemotaxis protein